MSDEKGREVCTKVIDLSRTAMLRAHGTLWAVAQALTENNDMTVNHIELESRISLAMELVAKYLMGVYDFLSDIEPMVRTGKPPEEILKRLKEAAGRC